MNKLFDFFERGRKAALDSEREERERYFNTPPYTERIRRWIKLKKEIKEEDE